MRLAGWVRVPARLRGLTEDVGAVLRDLPAFAARRRLDAPSVDPLAEDREMTTARLAGEFRILRASRVLAHEGALPSFEQIQVGDPDAWWFTEREPPRLVLFISHRWKGGDRPDPLGTQADALRGFLRRIQEVAAASAATAAERSQRVPSLFVHGVFQAAYLLGVADPAADDQDSWYEFVRAAVEAGDPAAAADTVLQHLGIWYDYACFPQAQGTGAAAESVRNREIHDGLRRLAALIEHSVVLSVRESFDGYAQRGWCAVELSVGKHRRRHVILRPDWAGEPFEPSELLGSEVIKHSLEQLVAGMQRWPDNPLHALHIVRYHFGLLDELEEGRTTPMFTSPRPPGVTPGLQPLLVQMIQQLGAVSRMDEERSQAAPASFGTDQDSVGLEIDVGALVANAMDAADLHCSHPGDVQYVALLMLYQRNRGVPEFARFYAECLRRVLDGESLQLLRYREDRDMTDPAHPMQMRVWWVFQGAPTSRPPAWVAVRDHAGLSLIPRAWRLVDQAFEAVFVRAPIAGVRAVIWAARTRLGRSATDAVRRVVRRERG
jgi:hypothetical protein